MIGNLIAGIVAGAIGMGIVLIGIIGIFLFAIMGALIGAITGTILQNVPFLGEMVVQGFTQFGIINPNLGQIGAALGFVAGFFKQNFDARQK